MESLRNRQRWAKYAAWLWAVLLLIACLFPSEEIPDVDVPLADKWVHFLMFGVQTVLSLAALKNPMTGNVLRASFGCALFGAVVEVLQLLTNRWLHRAFDWMDIVADTIGVLLGMGLFRLLQKTVFRNNASAA